MPSQSKKQTRRGPRGGASWARRLRTRRCRWRPRRRLRLSANQHGGTQRAAAATPVAPLYAQWKRCADNATRSLSHTKPLLPGDLQRFRSSSLFTEIPASVRERIVNALPLTPDTSVKLAVTLPSSTQHNPRTADIYLAVEPQRERAAPPPLHTYLEMVVQWLLFVSSLAQAHCSPHLDIFLLLTDQPKELDEEGEATHRSPGRRRKRKIAAEHANTAFTFACPAHKNEIVVFRREEWFKVFVHESFHAFGLDFSHLATAGNDAMYRLFPRLDPQVDLRISETYSEVWAEWWQCVLAAQGSARRLRDLLAKEQQFALFQANKVLQHAGGWSFEDMMRDPTDRDDRYREDTAAFAYYVLRAAVLFHIDDFMAWCQRTNRGHVMQFAGSESVASFCEFLEGCCRDPAFREAVDAMRRAPPTAFATPWFRRTMRMTVTNFV